VIAVIAILASVLLPALNSARYAAKGISCKSNLRQIGQMLFNYELDFGGYLPAAESATYRSDGDSRPWPYILYQLGYIRPDADKSITNWWSCVTPNNCKLMKCEMNDNPYYQIGISSTTVTYDCHYGINPDLAHQCYGTACGSLCVNWRTAFIQRSRITRISERLLLGESCSYGYKVESREINCSALGGAWYPHRSHMSMFMLDGHVESRTYSKMGAWTDIIFGGGSL